MPYELPRPLTGNVRADIENLWDAVFRLTEQLRLAQEQGKSGEEAK